jgi:hypothetical protein
MRSLEIQDQIPHDLCSIMNLIKTKETHFLKWHKLQETYTEIGIMHVFGFVRQQTVGLIKIHRTPVRYKLVPLPHTCKNNEQENSKIKFKKFLVKK